MRDEAERICSLTDDFCAERLDGEYAALCRRLVGKLARKRPSPLGRGDPRIWAAGTIYAVGAVNFLFDRSQTPHLRADELAELTGVAKSTMANKAKRIRELLRLGPLDFEFCRAELLERNPLVWLVEVNGIPMDARTLPPELQAEAHRRRLIPQPRPAAAA